MTRPLWQFFFLMNFKVVKFWSETVPIYKNRYLLCNQIQAKEATGISAWKLTWRLSQAENGWISSLSIIKKKKKPVPCGCQAWKFTFNLIYSVCKVFRQVCQTWGYLLVKDIASPDPWEVSGLSVLNCLVSDGHLWFCIWGKIINLNPWSGRLSPFKMKGSQGWRLRPHSYYKDMNQALVCGLTPRPRRNAAQKLSPP